MAQKSPLKSDSAPPRPMSSEALRAGLESRLIGQQASLHAIVPYIVAHSAGLSPQTRPVASVLLLGPTGTGKTRTVEALAEVLHGSDAKLLRVDCGQFALQHEVAKLMGAPPGYLGHRETPPLITQKKLADLTSEASGISIVLFDELEKAHPSVLQLLLSITDKSMFTLGDNTTVSFANSLLFFTSNLGAREMYNTLSPELGFTCAVNSGKDLSTKLERVGMVAVRKKFTPEFINRLDEILTYSPLSRESIEAIFTIAIDKLRATVYERFADRSFLLVFADEAQEFLISQGFSDRYGARELNRVIFRYVTKQLSEKIVQEGIVPGAIVRVSLNSNKEIILDILSHDEVQKTLAKGK